MYLIMHKNYNGNIAETYDNKEEAMKKCIELNKVYKEVRLFSIDKEIQVEKNDPEDKDKSEAQIKIIDGHEVKIKFDGKFYVGSFSFIQVRRLYEIDVVNWFTRYFNLNKIIHRNQVEHSRHL